jgi:pimeloyl-ACP methyl ester carboxylesterase
VLKTYAGGRLFGESYGQGAPWVLALHGWMRSHRDFDVVLEGIEAIAVDLPGFGAAPAPREAWSTAQYADWVAPVLDEMNPRPVVLGHSFGGRVAAHLAARHPDQIGALVLSGVPQLVSDGRARPKPPPAFRLGKALYRHGLIGADRMEAVRRRYGSDDYRAAEGVMRDVLVKAVNEAYDRQLAAFPGPIELVWGQDDDQAPLTAASEALRACVDGHLVSLSGVGHFTPQQAPAALRAAILRHRPGNSPSSGQPGA